MVCWSEWKMFLKSNNNHNFPSLLDPFLRGPPLEMSLSVCETFCFLVCYKFSMIFTWHSWKLICSFNKSLFAHNNVHKLFNYFIYILCNNFTVDQQTNDNNFTIDQQTNEINSSKNDSSLIYIFEDSYIKHNRYIL